MFWAQVQSRPYHIGLLFSNWEKENKTQAYNSSHAHAHSGMDETNTTANRHSNFNSKYCVNDTAPMVYRIVALGFIVIVILIEAAWKTTYIYSTNEWKMRSNVAKKKEREKKNHLKYLSKAIVFEFQVCFFIYTVNGNICYWNWTDFVVFEVL